MVDHFSKMVIGKNEWNNNLWKKQKNDDWPVGKITPFNERMEGWPKKKE